MKRYCTVVEIRRDYMCRALGLFLTHKQCVVETGQMSSVSETGQGPDTWKAMDLDNRTVTFQTDRTPQDRIAVRF